MRKLRNILFGSALIVFIFLVCELALRVAEGFHDTLTSSKRHIPPVIPDLKMGVRGNPDHPEHDANGYRNSAIPAPGEVELVTLGDSQTYGWGIPREKAWPQQLGFNHSLRVYNMAIDHSGPIHSLLLLKQAMALKPKMILVAIYSGNDLYDCYAAIYEKNLYPPLRSSSPSLLRTLDELESFDPIRKRIESETALAYRDNRPSHYLAPPEFTKWSRLGRLIWNYYLFNSEHRANWMDIRNEAMQTGNARPWIEEDSISTVFTPSYRLLALNQDDLRIREGNRILQNALMEMQRVSAEGGIPLMFILIPTKEYAYRHFLKTIPASNDIHEQIRRESTFWKETCQTLETGHLPYFEAHSALEFALQKHIPLYPHTWDGHPGKSGYKVIAEALWANSGFQKLLNQPSP